MDIELRIVTRKMVASSSNPSLLDRRPRGYLWLTADVYNTVNEADTEQLWDLPPSAKLVYKVLEYERTMAQRRLVEETRLSARTVRYALNSLQSIDAIEQVIYFADARKRLYSLTTTEHASDNAPKSKR